jgi:hypothetical protein
MRANPSLALLWLTVLLLVPVILGCAGDDPVRPDRSEPSIPGVEPMAGWDPADFVHVLDVGPGQALADPTEVAWESLAPSTLVRIHWRAEPYRAKWVINTEATEDAPLVVLGVPDPGTGARPIISGDGAVTRLELDFWNEDRSVVKIGGSSLPGGDVVPSWVVVQGLEIRSGRPGYTFTDESGASDEYRENAAAIHVEAGAHVTIADCELTDCGNGLFAGAQTRDLVVIGNVIHANGIEGSIYEHNSYTECLGIRFEFNRYGPLRPGCGGNNLKDRSAGTVIRYNWIEGGNRQLDLVETGHAELRDDPRYRETFVYGNVLIEPDGAGNSQIVHYGGDGGDESWYRKGTLHFYHNTVVSTRGGNTTLLRLSSADETADVRNAVVQATAGGPSLAILADAGEVALGHCWLPAGWRQSHEGDPSGTLIATGIVTGDDPGFADLPGQDFAPLAGSPLAGAGGPLAPAAVGHPVGRQYVRHAAGEPRDDGDAPAIGAFAARSGTSGVPD